MIRNNFLTFEIIGNGYDRSNFIIDLKAVAEQTGVFKTDDYVDPKAGKFYKKLRYPIPKARKLCKLIAQYADPEDFEAVSEVFKVNSKLMKIWEEALCRSRK